MNQNVLFEKYEIIGDYINNYLNKFKNILGTNTTILLTGETGTGKELIARWIHFNDRKRRIKPFVKITIPNIGENIFESEVFGYEKGAFTGAISSKKGLIEVAEDGTVFLDEIENAGPSVQSKLLQLMEDRIYRKVGGVVYSKTNARFIIATNKDLREEVTKKNFRSDLYYRLAVLEIKVPSLTERGRDIIQIANYYIKKFSEETGKSVSEFGENEYRHLSSYNWPGNVRELKNFVERAVIFSDGGHADLTFVPENTSQSTEEILEFNYKNFMREKETELIRNALARCSGNIENAAKLINMSVPFVYKKIREYNIKG